MAGGQPLRSSHRKPVNEIEGARGGPAQQNQGPLHHSAHHRRQPAWPAGGRDSPSPAVRRGSPAAGLGGRHPPPARAGCT